jgi:Ca2+-binding RTX toxin-like protein
MAVTQGMAREYRGERDLIRWYPEDILGLSNGSMALATTNVFNDTTTFWTFSPSLSLESAATNIAGVGGVLAQTVNGNTVLVTDTAAGLGYRIRTASSTLTGTFGTGANHPDVASLKGPAQGFVAAAAVNGDIRVYVRNNSGGAVAEFTVVASAEVDDEAAVAALNDGGYAVSWSRTVGSTSHLWMAVYNADGSVRKAPTALDAAGDINRSPSVVALASGGFAIAYEDYVGPVGHGSETRVTTLILDSAGAVSRTIGTESRLRRNTAPIISELANGLILITVDNDNDESIFDQDVLGYIVDPATGVFLRDFPGSTYVGFYVQGQFGFEGANHNAALREGQFVVAYHHDDDDNNGENPGTRLVRYDLVRTWTGDGADDTIVGDGFADRMDGGDGDDRLSGAGGNDNLTGGLGNDVLDGGADADRMAGGAGADTYYVDNFGDVIVEGADAGIDSVYIGTQYTLGANLENLFLLGSGAINGTGNGLDNRLVGNDGANQLDGLDGNDRIDGKLGGDFMRGGAGDDLYTVDNLNDQVREDADEGTDTVRSYLSYTLPRNVENLQLLGTGDIDATGRPGVNVLNGNAGNNVLDGRAGADTMTGGAGDDTYFVDDAGDVVGDGANQGNDTVKAAVSYTLANNIENLILTGTANIDGTGNNQANNITGNNGNNVLDGKGGVDVLHGGQGNDTYHVDDPGDAVTESNGQGFDTVVSSINFTLANNLENLTLVGGARLNGTGNGLANEIVGNAANNVLDGQKGNDTLTGGDGNDTFAFSTKLDAATNVDILADFVSGSDRLALSQSIFGVLPLGALASAAFVQAAAALTTAQRIVYDATTGLVSYDRDGSGSTAAVAFAQLTPGQALSYKDFQVV